MQDIPTQWQWFNEARYGMFIHWGPFSIHGRGEQVLNREFLDQNEYIRTACAWNPAHYDARAWAAAARDGGMKYVRDNRLYLIIRYWDRQPTLRLAGLRTPVRRATLLTTGQDLGIRQNERELVLSGLPSERPTALYPVIRLECEGRPEPSEWGLCRTWKRDDEFWARWAETRGTSVWADGKPR